MENNMHKGTELNNIKETWDQNERARAAGGGMNDMDAPAGTSEDLQRVIREEAAAYDNGNMEDRTLGGDRATVRDDEGEAGA